MTDRERLIVAIERAKEQSDEAGLDCIVVKFKEANLIIELLKEQPKQKFFVDSDGKMTPLPIQKHGHWIRLPKFLSETQCSVCKKTHVGDYRTFKFCPDCGARMDEEVEQE